MLVIRLVAVAVVFLCVLANVPPCCVCVCCCSFVVLCVCVCFCGCHGVSKRLVGSQRQITCFVFMLWLCIVVVVVACFVAVCL